MKLRYRSLTAINVVKPHHLFNLIAPLCCKIPLGEGVQNHAYLDRIKKKKNKKNMGVFIRKY